MIHGKDRPNFVLCSNDFKIKSHFAFNTSTTSLDLMLFH